MCGLVARFAKGEAPPFPIARMLESIRHRGPDARGAIGWRRGGDYRAGESAEVDALPNILGHVRLSIIDLSAAADQPFLSEDGRFALIYNGEIYNYLELRDQLEGCGRRFRTNSDSEVLLTSWAEWGLDCLEKLEGMFAFLLFDRAENKVYFARDAFGIKPLFVADGAQEVLFCSELGPLAARRATNDYDIKAAAQCLRWGSNDGFAETILTGIERVPPGVCRSLDLTSYVIRDERVFFDVRSIREEDWSFEDARVRLRDEFMASVDRHMRSDAELGFSLSGGIDSSAIVCAAHALGRTRIRTFTYVPDDARISELRWAQMVIDRIGAEAVFIRPLTADAVERLPNVIRSQGEPFGSLSIFAQNEVYRQVAANGVKVILTGQGADELLGGYIHYFQALIAREWREARPRRAIAMTGRLRDRFGLSLGGSLGWLGRAIAPAALRETLGDAYLRRSSPWLKSEALRTAGLGSMVDYAPGASPALGLHANLKESVRTSLAALLRYDDRNSMAHSVESRVPFLTPRLARLCLSFPEHFLISAEGVTKHVFREAMRGIIPDAIADRPDKIGFAPDMRAWSDAVLGLANAAGAMSSAGLDSILDRKRLIKTLSAANANGASDLSLAWNAVNLLALAPLYRSSE